MTNVKSKRELIQRFRDADGHLDIREHTDPDNYMWAKQTIQDWCDSFGIMRALDGPYIYEVFGKLPKQLSRRKTPPGKSLRHIGSSRGTMILSIPNTVRDQALNDSGLSLEEFEDLVRTRDLYVNVGWIDVPHLGKIIYLRLVPP